MKYSEELIQRLIKYLDARCHVAINKPQAELYLDSMANLYLILNKKNR